MRGASAAFRTYLTMADRHKSLPPSLAESVLSKTNAIVKEGFAFLKQVVEIPKVLFRPNRKTPANLLPVLLRKRATLVRTKPNGHGSHLMLDFGSFSMTIYFSPLLLTLRANEEEDGDENDGDNEKTSETARTVPGFSERAPRLGMCLLETSSPWFGTSTATQRFAIL
ncbi:unnamed protein product [Cylindrotheca closterium]|uniref:Uncharacterized protein n=1 Tax=Cylindrotheca closterium TaxID=2856 RepID=A0AAD2FS60_9STRA|nr:unnamed protein product [Cylindrotheca closterium]